MSAAIHSALLIYLAGCWEKVFAPESWPNWALVAVGIGATIVAWRTLSDIREQTRLLAAYVKATNEGVEATRTSAEAALKSAQAVINAERARLLVHIKWPKDFASQGQATRWGVSSYDLVVNIVCQNRGRSMAWITETRIGMVAVEQVPVEMDIGRTVRVDNEVEQPVIVDEQVLSPDLPLETPGTPKPEQTILIYGVVNYRDIFEQSRYTTFGFRLMKDRERFERISLPAYNKHT
jgi:hypothetical protein